MTVDLDLEFSWCSLGSLEEKDGGSDGRRDGRRNRRLEA